MKHLINEYVTGLRISDDQEYLAIDTPDAMIVYQAVGDCCSETWFAYIINVKALINATVKRVENLELPNYNLDDGRCRQNEDVAYGIRLTTNKGETDIIYRSNGYKVMIKLLRRLMSSRNPINPSDEERPDLEALFERGFANYTYNIELGDGYLISEKGRKIVSLHRERDTINE